MIQSDQPAGVAVDRGVRPSLLTEKELLDIVDQLIRDRAYNRPAAIAIAMAVGAAVEAEVRERCAALADTAAATNTETTARLRWPLEALAARIRGA